MSQNKIKIGIDIDEVVVEFFRGYLKVFNERFERDLDFEDWVEYGVWEFTDISKEDALDLFNEFQSSEKFDKLDLVEGSKEALIELEKNYEIYFITSRPEAVKEKTKVFLNNLFEFNFDLHFSGGVWGKSITKSEICKNLGIKIMIEDNYNYAYDCAEKGVKVFLLDKPWNRNFDGHENIIRVNNWKEILDELNLVESVELK